MCCEENEDKILKAWLVSAENILEGYLLQRFYKGFFVTGFFVCACGSVLGLWGQGRSVLLFSFGFAYLVPFKQRPPRHLFIPRVSILLKSPIYFSPSFYFKGTEGQTARSFRKKK